MTDILIHPGTTEGFFTLIQTYHRSSRISKLSDYSVELGNDRILACFQKSYMWVIIAYCKHQKMKLDATSGRDLTLTAFSNLDGLFGLPANNPSC